MPRDKLLTLEEVAEYLRLNRFTVYRMAERGELPGAKIARRWRFKEEDVQEWFRRRKQRRALRILPTQFEFHAQLLREAENLLVGKKIVAVLQKKLIYMTLHYFAKSRKLLRGINLLCLEGIASEAKILLRSLIEAAMLLEYVGLDPGDIARAEDCLTRGIVAEHKRLAELDQMEFYPPNLPSNVRANMNVVKINYRGAIERLRERHPQFNTLSDAKLVERTELNFTRLVDLLRREEPFRSTKKDVLRQWYASVVRDCSASVHCNDLEAHVRRTDDGKWEIRMDSKPSTVHIILRTSGNVFIEILECTNRILKLGEEDLVSNLSARYKKLFPSRDGRKMTERTVS